MKKFVVVVGLVVLAFYCVAEARVGFIIPHTSNLGEMVGPYIYCGLSGDTMILLAETPAGWIPLYVSPYESGGVDYYIFRIGDTVYWGTIDSWNRLTWRARSY